MISAEAKAKIIKSSGTHKSDTGSPQVQVSILTKRIAELTDHLKQHKLDHHSRRGLLQMVGQRKKLLRYLRDQDFEAYQKLIAELKLRG